MLHEGQQIKAQHTTYNNVNWAIHADLLAQVSY
jgi:hypothetical protein